MTNVLASPNKILNFFSKIIYKKNPIIETIDFAQIPALNVYPIIGHKIFNTGICFSTQPKERLSYLKNLVSYAEKKNKKLWVTELQAEPWEPGYLVYKGNEPITCWPESFKTTFDEVRSVGIGTIFLWGAEYWFYRRDEFHDDSWINAASGLLNRTKQKGSELWQD